MKNILKYVLLVCLFVPYLASGQGHISDSLFSLGIQHYNNNDYIKAIQLFRICDSIDMVELDSSDNRSQYSKMWIASCFYKLGDEETANDIYPHYYTLPPVDRKKTIKSDALAALAAKYFEAENYDSALIALKKCASIEQKQIGKYSLYYYNTIKECGYLCYNLNNYREAINYGEIAYSIAKKLFGKQSEETAESITNLILYYGDNEDYSKVYELTSTLEATYKLLYKEYPDELSKVLIEVFEYYSIIEEYNDAIRVLKESISLDNPENEEYLSKTHSLFSLFRKTKDYPSAIQIGEQHLNYWESQLKHVDSGRHTTAVIFSQLSDCYREYGLYTKSIELEKYSISILDSLNLKYDSLYLSILNNLATDYSEIGEYQLALHYGGEYIGNLKTIGDTNSSRYSLALSNLAYYYSLVGDHVSSYEIAEKAIRIFEQSSDKNREDYYYLFNNIATFYANIGNYDKAIEILKSLLDTVTIEYGKESIEYATVLNNHITYSSHTDCNIANLIDEQKECSQIIKRIYGEESIYFLSSEMNLAVLFSELNPESAIKIFYRLESLYIEQYGNNSPELIILYYNFANAYNLIKKHEQALYYLSKANDIITQNRVLCIPILFRVQSAMFHVNKDLNNFDHMRYWKQISNASITNLVQSEFALLTSNEREKYWELYSSWFYEELPQTIEYDTSSSNAVLLFNSNMMSHGLLLCSSSEIEKELSMEDTSILRRYNNLKTKRSNLNELLFSNTPYNIQDIDSIYRELEYQERILLKDSKTLLKLANYYSINYDSIVTVLDSEEIAIEFLSVPNDSITTYYALCVKKEYSSPHIIRLFSSLDTININSSIIFSQIYGLVWHKLKAELDGVKKVYFTPSGILHIIPIEQAILSDDNLTAHFFSQRYRTYRLSSLRELYYAKTDTTRHLQAAKSFALFGGLDYGSFQNQTSNFKEGPVNSNGQRTRAAEYLGEVPYTEMEIDAIRGILPKYTQCSVYGGALGTETAFKSLSGKKVDVIHIATHGFYSSDNLYHKERKLRNVTSSEDRTLTQTGLYMAGYNSLNDAKTTSNDGILTAREISELNLQGTKLAVLSSCRSGMGELKGDGIYGMQRSLKKAGVESVIISLWNVDDYATQLLMEEFYKRYTSGASIKKSLEDAQSFVRDYSDENGVKLFSDPYYWASFILIDALE